jgi:ABC-type transport system substrate-binding protein
MKFNYQHKMWLYITAFAFTALLTAGCGNEKSKEIIKPGHVVIHLAAEPKSLNPTNSSGAESTQIYYHTSQELINADFKTMEIVPVLAKERAKFTPIQGSDWIEMSFEIRDSARWDNGTPITAEDVVFSLKTIKIPQTDCGAKRAYFEFIKDVKADKANPKKVVFVCEPYMLNETSMSDLHILPKYFYDDKGLLNNYTIKQLSDTTTAARTKLEADKNLIAFADRFNSVEFSKQKIAGSGPYELASWKADERIILRKKKNWWGESQSKEEQWYQAYPDSIIYEVIPSLPTAFSALQANRINTMTAIEVADYNAAKSNANFTDKFYTFEPPIFGYDYVGFNLNNPMFQDVNTRKAIAHLVDIDQLIKTAAEGYAEPSACFTHPSKKAFLNPNVKSYEYSLDKAREYLKLAGWADANKDGILEKNIDGKRTDFKCTIITNNTNTRRITACQLLANAAKEVGILLIPQTPEWADFVTMIKESTYDMMVLGLISSPFESDPKQTWHSASTNGNGSNYCNYASPQVDKWIDDMRKITDESKRYPYYHKIHQQIHDDVPVVFLLAMKERMAVSKQFQNVWETAMKPGFWGSGFHLGEKMAQ